MNAALARAHAAWVAISLQPDGKLLWRATRPIEPVLRADLRARRAEILMSFSKTAEVTAASAVAGAAVIAEAEAQS